MLTTRLNLLSTFDKTKEIQEFFNSVGKTRPQWGKKFTYDYTKINLYKYISYKVRYEYEVKYKIWK